MTAPTIIGLDLSLAATGVSTETGESTIKTPAADPIETRLATIRTEIMRIQAGTPDALAVIEDLPKHVAHGATQLGMVHGVIRLALVTMGTPFVLVPPASLKKYIAGKGNAPKGDMRMATYKRFGLDFTDDNQCDAFGLRAMGLDAYGTPLADMPAANRAALEAIDWPLPKAAVA